ncbi:MAG: ribokinase [Armatimonadetes bacterium]|nr:ribokinase [Armatimonadota bacterium]MDW8122303.1 ribokinase [Armatimonadota bacterium]
MPPVKVVVVGSANMDLIGLCPHLPAPGETVLGTGFEMACGGKGANQAVACARLGAVTFFVCRLGKDSFGDLLEENLRKEGIRTDAVVRDSEMPSGVALIFVDSKGQNQILVAPGSNGRLSPSDWQGKEEVWKGADALLLQLEIPVETVAAALHRAREEGALTVLNAAPFRPLPQHIWSQVSVCVVNEKEAEAFTGVPVAEPNDAVTAGQWFLARGTDAVVVTLGEKGSVLVLKDSYTVFPAFAVNAVDATAAGDAFCGALTVRLAEKAPLTDALPFANAAGALACTRLGAQPSLPTRQEVETFLKERTAS